MPDFLATRNCSSVRIFFHSASVLTTFSVGSSGALLDVSIGFLAWHDVRVTANMTVLIRWLSLFIAGIGGLYRLLYSNFLKMQLSKCLMMILDQPKVGCDNKTR